MTKAIFLSLLIPLTTFGAANTSLFDAIKVNNSETFANMTPASVPFFGTGGLVSQDNTNFNYTDSTGVLALGNGNGAGTTQISVTSTNETQLKAIDGSGNTATYGISGGLAFTERNGQPYFVQSSEGTMWSPSGSAGVPRYAFHLLQDDSSILATDIVPQSAGHNLAVAVLQNYLGTVNNYSGFAGSGAAASSTSATAVDGAMLIRHEVHTAASETGHLEFYVENNGGGLAQVMNLSKTGALQLNTYTAGCLQTDSSGNVTANTCFSGTVTAVSVVSANGFAGSSSGGSAPALTLSTTVNSPVLAGNGTAILAATTTGSGSTAVLATAPTMTNPVVGTQSAGDNSTKAASTAFVQAALAQLNPAAAVKSASTANITGTYTNAVGGVCIGDTFQVTSTAAFVVDGITLTVGQRVLFKNQTSAFQNGVWTLTTAANVGVLGALLTRALDWDSSADMNAGGLIPVISGTSNANTVWFQTAAITTCSSDSQVYTQFSGGSSGDTVALLTKTGNYSVLVGDFSTSTKRLLLECNGSSLMTVTLPALSGAGGYTITVKNIGTAECDVVPAGSDKIDGDTILQLMPGGLPQSGDELVGGSQWDIAS